VHATEGDWLIVKSASDSRPERRGLIRTVQDDGRPPYVVRWTDNDHEALVFPGPDAVVVSAAELKEHDRVRDERTARFQAEMLAHHHDQKA
jgi:hypothetical protein